MKTDQFESVPRWPPRLTLLVFAGGYLFGLYLIYVLFFSQDWDKYPILVIWIISNLLFPGLGLLLGNKSLWLSVLPVLYGAYAVIAYKRLGPLGLYLFMTHYVVAALLLGMLLFYAKADIRDLTFVAGIFLKNPILFLYLSPFVFGNFWYLYRFRLRVPRDSD